MFASAATFHEPSSFFISRFGKYENDGIKVPLTTTDELFAFIDWLQYHRFKRSVNKLYDLTVNGQEVLRFEPRLIRVAIGYPAGQGDESVGLDVDIKPMSEDRIRAARIRAVLDAYGKIDAGDLVHAESFDYDFNVQAKMAFLLSLGINVDEFHQNQLDAVAKTFEAASEDETIKLNKRLFFNFYNDHQSRYKLQTVFHEHTRKHLASYIGAIDSVPSDMFVRALAGNPVPIRFVQTNELERDIPFSRFPLKPIGTIKRYCFANNDWEVFLNAPHPDAVVLYDGHPISFTLQSLEQWFSHGCTKENEDAPINRQMVFATHAINAFKEMTPQAQFLVAHAVGEICIFKLRLERALELMALIIKGIRSVEGRCSVRFTFVTYHQSNKVAMRICFDRPAPGAYRFKNDRTDEFDPDVQNESIFQQLLQFDHHVPKTGLLVTQRRAAVNEIISQVNFFNKNNLFGSTSIQFDHGPVCMKNRCDLLGFDAECIKSSTLHQVWL